MDDKRGIGRELKPKYTKCYNGKDVTESYYHSHPEGTYHRKKIKFSQ